MTELTPPPAKKSRIHTIIIAIVLVIAAIAALGYYASKAGLDKALVKQEVDAWIERTKLRAADEGYTLAITYDDVAIKGGLTDGHALISNIKVSTTSEDAAKNVTFTTAEIRLEPKSANLRDVEVILPAPIHVFEEKNTHESASLISDAPLAFEVERIEENDQFYQRIAHKLPPKITLRFLVGQDAVGEEEKKQDLTPRYDVIEVTSEDSTLQITTHDKQNDIGNSLIELHKVTIVPIGSEEGTITIGGFKSTWSNALNKKNLNVIDVSVALDDVSANESFMPYAPLNLALQAQFEGAMPTTPEAFAKIQSQQTSFKVKEFAVSTKDATFNLTADFVANQNDILPVGMANVSVGNVPSWRELLKQNAMLNNKNEELLNTLFIRIVGQTLPDAKDISIDIQRAREGAFQIGNITFEELLAIALGGVRTPLDIKLPAPTEQAAPVDAVKSE
jgi:hypothetical protein